MAKYRILSIDGGGIRGIVTTVMMQRLKATPGLEGFLENVDLVAGTSTGGLLALGIARGLDLDEIRDLYVNDGPKIFDDSWLDDLLDLGKLRGADYKIAPMRRVFKRVLGEETTLGQLGKRVLITAFDMDNEDDDELKRTWKPKLFHNFPGDGNDRHELAHKVGMYTAAAPTYFPSVDGFIDGGVYANNPAMCALAQTQADPGNRRDRAAVARHRHEPLLHPRQDPGLGLRAVDQAADQSHARRHFGNRRLPVPSDAAQAIPPTRADLPTRCLDPDGRRREDPLHDPVRGGLRPAFDGSLDAAALADSVAGENYASCSWKSVTRLECLSIRI
jgi:predicted acylesterase/phospholipase RssA